MADASKISIDVRNDLGLPHGAVVKLNGAEVPGLRGLTLRMAVDSFNEVELVLAVDTVDVTADAMVALQAHLHVLDELDDEGEG